MKKSRSAVTSFFLIVLVAGHMLVSATPAEAEPISVTENTDEFNTDGDCSLREALVAANTDAAIDDCPAGSSTETDDILLEADRYELSRTSGPVNTFGHLYINSNLRISGAGVNESIVDANGIYRAVFVGGGMGVNVSFNYFQITGGEVTGDYGAGILNQADLRLNNMLITNNHVIGNTGGDYGGGIVTYLGSRTRINASEVSQNTAFFGAGIVNSEDTTIKDSLIWFNTASGGGGGFLNGGTATLSNVTISDNLAESYGGGIYNQVNSDLIVKNATVFDNKAGSGFPSNIDHQGTSIEVSNTIVGQPSSGINCGGEAITSSGHNLSSDDTCDFDLGSDIENRNPRVRDLADNGGRTSTHALKRSSPAVNAGAGNLAKDQRGVPRPQGSSPDMGAYELAFCSGTVVNVVGTPFADILRGHTYRDGILGLGRDDILKGGGAGDRLCGGTGADRVKGGGGNDKLLGQKGNDTHSGGPGTDVCRGGLGTDSATSCESTTGIP